MTAARFRNTRRGPGLGAPRAAGRAPLRILLVLAGTLLGLGLCEVGLRVHHTVEDARKLAEWRAIEEPVRLPTEGRVRLGHLIRPHAERRIVYELIPNLSVEFMGAAVETNAAGFRGPAYPLEPGPDTVRIVGLGDSIMFGWGVAYEACFMSVLARGLSEAHPGTTFEVINTAVPGYNTAAEVETLKVKGLAYRPDVVVISYVGNDLSLPNFIVQRRNHWSPYRLYLLAFLRSATSDREPSSFRPFEPAPRHGKYQFEFEPDKVPEEYADMVGVDAHRSAMRELVELGAQHGFHVVAMARTPPDHLREVCDELGILLVDVGPRWDRYVQESANPDAARSELIVSEHDPHPSALAHALHAEELHRQLSEAGVLQQVIARRRSEER